MTGVLVFSTVFLSAQTEKGKFLLIGSTSLNADFGKSKTKTGSTTVDNYKYLNLDLNPMAGYTVIDNLPIGAYLSFDIHNMTYTDDDHYSKGTSFVIGPFARYYFANLNGFQPMVEAAIGFGVDNTKYNYGSGETKNNAFMWEYWAGPGFTYFLNDHIGIDGMIGYYHQIYNYKGDNNFQARSEDHSDIYNDIFLYFGVSVILGK
jgi:outer membrane protein